MIKSFLLSLSSLNNKSIRSILFKSILLTLTIIIIAGIGLFIGGGYLLSLIGWGIDIGSWSYLITTIINTLLIWFLFRTIAVLVLWMFADDIVEAIEWQHYSHAALTAAKPSWFKSLLVGLRSLLRAILYNILAIPLYIIAAFTVIGAPIIFMVINGILLGRELEEMVTLRHQGTLTESIGGGKSSWGLGKFERFMLGFSMNAAMMIPFVNFLIPVIATSTATHMMNRSDD